MPRKAFIDPPWKRNISLPSSLMAKVEMYLIDPVSGRRKYGAFSELVTRLLREELARKGIEVKEIKE